MGWFWADSPATPSPSLPPSHPRIPPSQDGARSPPPGCPMHKHQRAADAMTPSSAAVASTPAAPATCPVKHSPAPSSSEPARTCPVPHSSRNPEPEPSTLSKLNPLNYMFKDLSQDRAPSQQQALPTEREPSTIPRGDGTGLWEYPSPQQMYNALLRKGYSDTDVTAVESMVSVHNFLNEGAWAEIMEWERRFSGGLAQGVQLCRRGEGGVDVMAKKLQLEKEMEERAEQTSLVRFQGRPNEMTPKAAMIQMMAWLYPGGFGTEPPFDRHDWYVSREQNGQRKEVRYIIDYYSGPPEPTGEPVFFLDVRPAFTPTGASERAIRWGSELWWKATGGDYVEAERLAQAKRS